jgi:Aerotolerance regulator N-terminal
LQFAICNLQFAIFVSLFTSRDSRASGLKAMGFVTPALLGGAALIAMPIALHLIMRREAQKLRFPALRFVQQRRNVNQHRLRLRHLLLLALRCAIIALLAFALARPTLRGSSAAGKEGVPVASALVFDNSLRMDYQHANRSRLDEAKDLAGWLLEQLPADSPVTVVDRAGRQRGQDLDRSAAELRIERLENSAAVRPMEDALNDAVRWLQDKPDYRGEIYVFTDLAGEAWPESMRVEFAKQLDASPGTNIYLIDVGAEQPRNLGLGALRLSTERLAPGGVLQIETEMTEARAPASGENAIDLPPGEIAVELYMESDTGETLKRGQQIVALGSARSSAVTFPLSNLELGTHQGFVRLAGNDALASDDVRYFTIDVRPPTNVLLLGETDDDVLFLREAIAPSGDAELNQSKFACTFGEFKQIGELVLAEYAAVCLVDPPPLPAEAWQALVNYAESGGGVGVFLGRRARRDEMNGSEPQVLLPARLRWQSHEETYLRPVAVEHLALAELRDLGDTVPWPEFPVFKYWELEAGAEQAHVVASFANGKPALVERQVGAGRVMLMTTPVSDPAYDDPWNLLPTAPEPWPFLALANGVAEYLTAAGNARLNYLAGQAVVLRLAPEEQVASYALQMPDRSAVRQSLAPGQQDVAIAAAEMLGNYRVRAGGRAGRLDRGFSVNLPAEITRLDRVPGDEIVKAIGDRRTRIARTRDDIEVRIGLARVGRELFPWLILAVALVLALEQLLANRFYRAANVETKEPPRSDAPRGNAAPSRSAAMTPEPVGSSL